MQKCIESSIFSNISEVQIQCNMLQFLPQVFIPDRVWDFYGESAQGTCHSGSVKECPTNILENI